MLDLMDPTLSDSFIKDQMLRFIHVGLLCVGDSAIDRRTMSDVIAMLSNDCLTLPSLEKPIFSIARNAIEAHICEKELENYSIYGLSISNMVAR